MFLAALFLDKIIIPAFICKLHTGQRMQFGLEEEENTFTPCVEDITIRVTRPGGAGLHYNGHHVKPSTRLEDGRSIVGLRPGGALRPVVINRRYGKTCNVRQE